jgi:hypothetical protein
MLTDSNTAFWMVMLGASYLQWALIFWLIIHLRARSWLSKPRSSGS